MSNTNGMTSTGVDVDKAKARIAAATDVEDARFLANLILAELVETRQYVVSLFDSGRVGDKS